ncbi:MAG: flagellar motor protein MotA [Rhodospirillaceae bacterium]|nr:flagellar motor protein MotA [Rhodospirillaceae bacterium]
MMDSRTYLTRMTVFLVALGVGMALVGTTLLPIFLVNPVLNGVIFVAIVFGVVLNFRQVIQLGPEARWLERFHAGPQDGPSGETVFTDLRATSDLPGEMTAEAPPENIRLLSPMARMLEGKRKGRLTLSAQAMRTLLDGIAARLEESRDLSRYMTGLCIFLGLLGTFWGLLGTVSSIGDVIRTLSVGGEDITAVFTRLKAGLEAPLKDMGTAFSSSLFGLGGSLALGFLDLQAGQAQNAFFNELEEWLSGVTRLSSGSVGEGEHGVSAYTEALLEQTGESLQELQNIMSRTEQSRLTGNEQLAELNQKLSLFADQMRAEQQIMLRIAEGQRDIAPLIRGVGELANAITSGGMPGGGAAMDDATRAHIRNIDASLTRLVSALAANRDDTVREIRNEIKLLAKTIASTAPRAPGDPY